MTQNCVVVWMVKTCVNVQIHNKILSKHLVVNGETVVY